MKAYFLVIDGTQTREWATGWNFFLDNNNPLCPTEPKYDCINGVCAISSLYNTPGFYESLEACQAECGQNQSSCPAPFQCIDPNNYCPPGKVCIPQNEWSQIEGLAGQLKNKNCS